MPTRHRAFAPEWQRAAADCDAKAAEIQEQVTRRHDATARPLSQLQIGNRLDLQDTDTGRWDRTGVVVGIGRRRTYLVKTASGRLYWRNRRFLRPYRPLLDTGAPPSAEPSHAAAASPAVPEMPPAPAVTEATPSAASATPDAPAAAPPAPRRSSRHRQRPERLNVRWGGATYCP